MRSARAFDPVLGRPLEWARCEGVEWKSALVLCFEGAAPLRLSGAGDGVSLECLLLTDHCLAVGPCPAALTACVGRRLVAALPSVHEYESVHDGLEASGVVLEFEGGRRVWIEHACGELSINRTGRTEPGDDSATGTRRTG